MRVLARIALLMTSIVVPSPALAQGIAESLHELRLLVRPGETVTVRDAAGREVKGRIESLSATAIVLQTSGGPQQWSDVDLREIRQRRGDPLGNGALIGLGVGAAIGVAGGLALRESGESGAAVAAFAAVYGGLGAGIGVGIDALVTRQYVIYRPRSAPAVTLRLAPLFGPGARGLRVSLSF